MAASVALVALLPTAGCSDSEKGSGVPRPDHVVVVIEENRGYEDIIGSPQAPYLNELARQGANLTQFYAITYPSQPNYIALFSGSTQGVNGNDCPNDLTGHNLASRLLQADLTFVGYAESLPSVGYTGCNSGPYVRLRQPLGELHRSTGLHQPPMVRLSKGLLGLADGVLRRTEPRQRHARRQRPAGRHLAAGESRGLRPLGDDPQQSPGGHLGRGRGRRR